MGSNRYVLGADTRSIVVCRLLDALTKQDQSAFAGSAGDVQVQWVLSLSEKHSVIYKVVLGDTLNLYVQLADTSMLPAIRLTAKDKKRWISILTSIACK
jgi:hypothetical protein